MQQELLNFRGRARLPVILQTEAAECGLACLGMVTSYFGHRIDIDTLRRRHPVSLKGVTLRALIDIARHLKLAWRKEIVIHDPASGRRGWSATAHDHANRTETRQFRKNLGCVLI